MFHRDVTSGVYSTGKFLNCIQTPAPIVPTYAGNPLYTTPDAIDEALFPYIGQVNVSDVVYKDYSDISVHQLYKHNPLVKLLLSGRSMRSDTSNCESGGLNVNTHNGRRQLTIDQFAKRMLIDHPQVVISMADEVNLNVGRKRFSKAVERTAHWFQQLLLLTKEKQSSFVNVDSNASSKGANWEDTFLFAVAQYNKDYPQQLPLLMQHMLSQGARGIVIGGCYMGESAVDRERAVRAIQAQLLLNHHDDHNNYNGTMIPTLIQGADTLSDIMESLSYGVDLISTNYPTLLCCAGLALAVDMTCNIDNHKFKKVGNENTSKTIDIQQPNNCNKGTTNKDVIVNNSSCTISSITTRKRPFVAMESNNNCDDIVDRLPPPPSLSSSSSLDVANTVGNSNNILLLDTAAAAHKTERGGSRKMAKINSCEAAAVPTVVATVTTTTAAVACEMNLWDSGLYRKDTRPLIVGCQCHACKHHTRAYIHHLLIAKEMLAEVLLYHHNQHQIMLLFAEARRHIKRNTLKEWSQTILEQI